MFRQTSEATVARLHAAQAAGDPVAYLASARKASAKFPRDGEVLIALAVALSENNFRDESADLSMEVVKISNDASILVRAAWSFVSANRFEAANAAAQRALSTGPHEPLIQNEALYLRGISLSALGRPRLAEKFLRDALARDHERTDFIHGLAFYFLAYDRRQEALELIAVAERVEDPTDRAQILNELAEMGLS